MKFGSNNIFKEGFNAIWDSTLKRQTQDILSQFNKELEEKQGSLQDSVEKADAQKPIQDTIFLEKLKNTAADLLKNVAHDPSKAQAVETFENYLEKGAYELDYDQLKEVESVLTILKSPASSSKLGFSKEQVALLLEKNSEIEKLKELRVSFVNFSLIKRNNEFASVPGLSQNNYQSLELFNSIMKSEVQLDELDDNQRLDLMQLIDAFLVTEIPLEKPFSKEEKSVLCALKSDLVAGLKPDFEHLKEIRDSFSQESQLNGFEKKISSRKNLLKPNQDVKNYVDKLISENKLSLNASNEEIAKLILAHIQQNFTYKSDAKDGFGLEVDVWQDASTTLSKKTGDCEDLSILLTSMLTQVYELKGVPKDEVDVSLVAGYLDSSKDKALGHAMTKLVIDGESFSLDATSTNSLVKMSEIDFDTVFEMTDSQYLKHKDVDQFFVTASNFRNSFGLTYDANGEVVLSAAAQRNMAEQIYSRLEDAEALLSRPIEIPRLFGDKLAVGFDIFDLIAQSDYTIDATALSDAIPHSGTKPANHFNLALGNKMYDHSGTALEGSFLGGSSGGVNDAIGATKEVDNLLGAIKAKLLDQNVGFSTLPPDTKRSRKKFYTWLEREVAPQGVSDVTKEAFSKIKNSGNLFKLYDPKTQKAQIETSFLNVQSHQFNDTFTIADGDVPALAILPSFPANGGMSSALGELRSAASGGMDNNFFTVEIDDKKFHEYLKGVRDAINSASMSFFLANQFAGAYSDTATDLSLEGQGIAGQERENYLREKAKGEKYIQKTIQSMSTFQERQSSSSQEILDSVTSFVTSVNDGLIKKANMKVDFWQRQNFGESLSGELAESFTGYLSFARTTTQAKINLLKVKTQLKNTNAFMSLSNSFYDEITTLTGLQTQSPDNSMFVNGTEAYRGGAGLNSLNDIRTNMTNFKTPFDRLKGIFDTSGTIGSGLNNMTLNSNSLDSNKVRNIVSSARNEEDASASSLGDSFINIAKAASGDEKKFLDLDRHLLLELNREMMEYQNSIRMTLMVTHQIRDQVSKAAAEIGGGKQSKVVQSINNVAFNMLEVELNRQTSNMGQAISNVATTVSTLNEFTTSMIHASVAAAEKSAKMQKLHINLSTFPIILAGSIAGGAVASGAASAFSCGLKAAPMGLGAPVFLSACTPTSTAINTPFWVNFIQYGVERVKEVGVELNFAKRMLDAERDHDESNYQTTMFSRNIYKQGGTYAKADYSKHSDFEHQSSGSYSSGLTDRVFNGSSFSGQNVFQYLQNSLSAMKAVYTQNHQPKNLSAGIDHFDGGNLGSHVIPVHLPMGLVVETGHGEVKKNSLMLANLRETIVSMEKVIQVVITMINAQAEAYAQAAAGISSSSATKWSDKMAGQIDQVLGHEQQIVKAFEQELDVLIGGISQSAGKQGKLAVKEWDLNKNRAILSSLVPIALAPNPGTLVSVGNPGVLAQSLHAVAEVAAKAALNIEKNIGLRFNRVSSKFHEKKIEDHFDYNNPLIGNLLSVFNGHARNGGVNQQLKIQTADDFLEHRRAGSDTRNNVRRLLNSHIDYNPTNGMADVIRQHELDTLENKHFYSIFGNDTQSLRQLNFTDSDISPGAQAAIEASNAATVNSGAVPPENAVNIVRNWDMTNWETYEATWGNILSQFESQSMDKGQDIANASVIDNEPIMPAYPGRDLASTKLKDQLGVTALARIRSEQQAALNDRAKETGTTASDLGETVVSDPTAQQRTKMGLQSGQSVQGATTSSVTGVQTRTYSSDTERNTIGRILRLQEAGYKTGTALTDPLNATDAAYQTRVTQERTDARLLLNTLFGAGSDANNFNLSRNYNAFDEFNLKGALDDAITQSNTISDPALKTQRENLIKEIIRMEPREAANPDLLPQGVKSHTQMNNTFLTNLSANKYDFIQKSTVPITVASDGSDNFFARLKALWDQNAGNLEIQELIKMKYVQYAVYNQKRSADVKTKAADSMQSQAQRLYNRFYASPVAGQTSAPASSISKSIQSSLTSGGKSFKVLGTDLAKSAEVNFSHYIRAREAFAEIMTTRMLAMIVLQAQYNATHGVLTKMFNTSTSTRVIDGVMRAVDKHGQGQLDLLSHALEENSQRVQSYQTYFAGKSEEILDNLSVTIYGSIVAAARLGVPGVSILKYGGADAAIGPALGAFVKASLQLAVAENAIKNQNTLLPEAAASNFVNAPEEDDEEPEVSGPDEGAQQTEDSVSQQDGDSNSEFIGTDEGAQQTTAGAQGNQPNTRTRIGMQGRTPASNDIGNAKQNDGNHGFGTNFDQDGGTNTKDTGMMVSVNYSININRQQELSRKNRTAKLMQQMAAQLQQATGEIAADFGDSEFQTKASQFAKILQIQQQAEKDTLDKINSALEAKVKFINDQKKAQFAAILATAAGAFSFAAAGPKAFIKKKTADKKAAAHKSGMKEMKQGGTVTKDSIAAKSKLGGSWATWEKVTKVLSLTADISKLVSTFAAAAVQFDAMAAGYEAIMIDETEGEEEQSLKGIRDGSDDGDGAFGSGLNTVGLETASQSMAYVSASTKQANTLLQGITSVMGQINSNFTQYFIVGTITNLVTQKLNSAVKKQVDKVEKKVNSKHERFLALDNKEKLDAKKDDLNKKIDAINIDDADSVKAVATSLSSFSEDVEKSGDIAMISALAAMTTKLTTRFNEKLTAKPSAPKQVVALDSFDLSARSGQVSSSKDGFVAVPGKSVSTTVEKKHLVNAGLVKDDGKSKSVIRSTTLGMTSAEIDRRLIKAGVTDFADRAAAVKQIQDAKFFKSDLKATDNTKQAAGERKVMKRMREEGLFDAAGNPTEKYLKVILNSDTGIDDAVKSLTRGTGVSAEFKANMKARFEHDRNTTLKAKQDIEKSKNELIHLAYNSEDKAVLGSMIDIAVTTAAAAMTLGLLASVLDNVDEFLSGLQKNEDKIQERLKEFEEREAKESIKESKSIIAAGSTAYTDIAAGSTSYTDNDGKVKKTTPLAGSVFSPMRFFITSSESRVSKLNKEGENRNSHLSSWFVSIRNFATSRIDGINNSKLGKSNNATANTVTTIAKAAVVIGAGIATLGAGLGAAVEKGVKNIFFGFQDSGRNLVEGVKKAWGKGGFLRGARAVVAGIGLGILTGVSMALNVGSLGLLDTKNQLRLGGFILGVGASAAKMVGKLGDAVFGEGAKAAWDYMGGSDKPWWQKGLIGVGAAAWGAGKAVFNLLGGSLYKDIESRFNGDNKWGTRSKIALGVGAFFGSVLGGGLVYLAGRGAFEGAKDQFNKTYQALKKDNVNDSPFTAVYNAVVAGGAAVVAGIFGAGQGLVGGLFSRKPPKKRSDSTVASTSPGMVGAFSATGAVAGTGLLSGTRTASGLTSLLDNKDDGAKLFMQRMLQQKQALNTNLSVFSSLLEGDTARLKAVTDKVKGLQNKIDNAMSRPNETAIHNQFKTQRGKLSNLYSTKLMSEWSGGWKAVGFLADIGRNLGTLAINTFVVLPVKFVLAAFRNPFGLDVNFKSADEMGSIVFDSTRNAFTPDNLSQRDVFDELINDKGEKRGNWGVAGQGLTHIGGFSRMAWASKSNGLKMGAAGLDLIASPLAILYTLGKTAVGLFRGFSRLNSTTLEQARNRRVVESADKQAGWKKRMGVGFSTDVKQFDFMKEVATEFEKFKLKTGQVDDGNAVASQVVQAINEAALLDKDNEESEKILIERPIRQMAVNAQARLKRAEKEGLDVGATRRAIAVELQNALRAVERKIISEGVPVDGVAIRAQLQAAFFGQKIKPEFALEGQASRALDAGIKKAFDAIKSGRKPRRVHRGRSDSLSKNVLANRQKSSFNKQVNDLFTPSGMVAGLVGADGKPVSGQDKIKSVNEFLGKNKDFIKQLMLDAQNGKDIPKRYQPLLGFMRNVQEARELKELDGTRVDLSNSSTPTPPTTAPPKLAAASTPTPITEVGIDQSVFEAILKKSEAVFKDIEAALVPEAVTITPTVLPSGDSVEAIETERASFFENLRFMENTIENRRLRNEELISNESEAQQLARAVAVAMVEGFSPGFRMFGVFQDAFKTSDDRFKQVFNGEVQAVLQKVRDKETDKEFKATMETIEVVAGVHSAEMKDQVRELGAPIMGYIPRRDTMPIVNAIESKKSPDQVANILMSDPSSRVEGLIALAGAHPLDEGVTSQSRIPGYESLETLANGVIAQLNRELGKNTLQDLLTLVDQIILDSESITLNRPGLNRDEIILNLIRLRDRFEASLQYYPGKPPLKSKQVPIAYTPATRPVDDKNAVSILNTALTASPIDGKAVLDALTGINITSGAALELANKLETGEITLQSLEAARDAIEVSPPAGIEGKSLEMSMLNHAIGAQRLKGQNDLAGLSKAVQQLRNNSVTSDAVSNLGQDLDNIAGKLQSLNSTSEFQDDSLKGKFHTAFETLEKAENVVMKLAAIAGILEVGTTSTNKDEKNQFSQIQDNFLLAAMALRLNDPVAAVKDKVGTGDSLTSEQTRFRNQLSTHLRPLVRDSKEALAALLNLVDTNKELGFLTAKGGAIDVQDPKNRARISAADPYYFYRKSLTDPVKPGLESIDTKKALLMGDALPDGTTVEDIKGLPTDLSDVANIQENVVNLRLMQKFAPEEFDTALKALDVPGLGQDQITALIQSDDIEWLARNVRGLDQNPHFSSAVAGLYASGEPGEKEAALRAMNAYGTKVSVLRDIVVKADNIDIVRRQARSSMVSLLSDPNFLPDSRSNEYVLRRILDSIKDSSENKYLKTYIAQKINRSSIDPTRKALLQKVSQDGRTASISADKIADLKKLSETGDIKLFGNPNYYTLSTDQKRGILADFFKEKGDAKTLKNIAKTISEATAFGGATADIALVAEYAVRHVKKAAPILLETLSDLKIAKEKDVEKHSRELQKREAEIEALQNPLKTSKSVINRSRLRTRGVDKKNVKKAAKAAKEVAEKRRNDQIKKKYAQIAKLNSEKESLNHQINALPSQYIQTLDAMLRAGKVNQLSEEVSQFVLRDPSNVDKVFNLYKAYNGEGNTRAMRTLTNAMARASNIDLHADLEKSKYRHSVEQGLDYDTPFYRNKDKQAHDAIASTIGALPGQVSKEDKKLALQFMADAATNIEVRRRVRGPETRFTGSLKADKLKANQAAQGRNIDVQDPIAFPNIAEDVPEFGTVQHIHYYMENLDQFNDDQRGAYIDAQEVLEQSEGRARTLIEELEKSMKTTLGSARFSAVLPFNRRVFDKSSGSAATFVGQERQMLVQERFDSSVMAAGRYEDRQRMFDYIDSIVTDAETDDDRHLNLQSLGAMLLGYEKSDTPPHAYVKSYSSYVKDPRTQIALAQLHKYCDEKDISLTDLGIGKNMGPDERIVPQEALAVVDALKAQSKGKPVTISPEVKSYLDGIFDPCGYGSDFDLTTASDLKRLYLADDASTKPNAPKKVDDTSGKPGAPTRNVEGVTPPVPPIRTVASAVTTPVPPTLTQGLVASGTPVPPKLTPVEGVPGGVVPEPVVSGGVVQEPVGVVPVGVYNAELRSVATPVGAVTISDGDDVALTAEKYLEGIIFGGTGNGKSITLNAVVAELGENVSSELNLMDENGTEYHNLEDTGVFKAVQAFYTPYLNGIQLKDDFKAAAKAFKFNGETRPIDDGVIAKMYEAIQEEFALDGTRIQQASVREGVVSDDVLHASVQEIQVDGLKEVHNAQIVSQPVNGDNATKAGNQVSVSATSPVDPDTLEKSAEQRLADYLDDVLTNGPTDEDEKTMLIQFFTSGKIDFTTFNIDGLDVDDLTGITLDSLGAVAGYEALPGKIQKMQAIFKEIQDDRDILGRSVADVVETYTTGEGKTVTGVNTQLRVDLVKEFVKQQRADQIKAVVPGLIEDKSGQDNSDAVSMKSVSSSGSSESTTSIADPNDPFANLVFEFIAAPGRAESQESALLSDGSYYDASEKDVWEQAVGEQGVFGQLKGWWESRTDENKGSLIDDGLRNAIAESMKGRQSIKKRADLFGGQMDLDKYQTGLLQKYVLDDVEGANIKGIDADEKVEKKLVDEVKKFWTQQLKEKVDKITANLKEAEAKKREQEVNQKAAFSDEQILKFFQESKTKSVVKSAEVDQDSLLQDAAYERLIGAVSFLTLNMGKDRTKPDQQLILSPSLYDRLQEKMEHMNAKSAFNLLFKKDTSIILNGKRIGGDINNRETFTNITEKVQVKLGSISDANKMKIDIIEAFLNDEEVF